MNDQHENEIRRFAMSLRRARRNAGDMPYREIARVSATDELLAST